MAISKNRIDEFMLTAQVMIENALSDPVVKTALSGYGYAGEKLQTGKKLYDEVVVLQNIPKKESGEQTATAGLDNFWEMMNKQYMKTLNVARVAFKDNPDADEALMLSGDRKQSFSGWLEQVQVFYQNILNDPDLMNIISEHGYSPEKLRWESSLLDQVIARSLQQKKEMGEAQEATEQRDKKLDELAQWIAELRVVAKVALEENPQQLEKMGIVKNVHLLP